MDHLRPIPLPMTPGLGRQALVSVLALALIGHGGFGAARAGDQVAEMRGRSALEPFRAMAISIGDGDTIRVQRGDQRITVRLACIDAPEMAQRPWGEMSRRYLAERLPLGSWVTISPQAIDRYGRTVAEVIGEIHLNLVMVEDGQAFAYRPYLQHCDATAYLEAEYRASRHRFGVWQESGGIERPWLFRHGQHHGSARESIPPRDDPAVETPHRGSGETVPGL
jgi:endonuclease YncB( thermonuclease family)